MSKEDKIIADVKKAIAKLEVLKVPMTQKKAISEFCRYTCI